MRREKENCLVDRIRDVSRKFKKLNYFREINNKEVLRYGERERELF